MFLIFYTSVKNCRPADASSTQSLYSPHSKDVVTSFSSSSTPITLYGRKAATLRFFRDLGFVCMLFNTWQNHTIEECLFFYFFPKKRHDHSIYFKVFLVSWQYFCSRAPRLRLWWHSPPLFQFGINTIFLLSLVFIKQGQCWNFSSLPIMDIHT